MIEFIQTGYYLSVTYYTLANIFYLFLLFLALFVMRQEQKYRPLLKKFITRRKKLLSPGISVIMPAYNEENSIVSSVKSILQQDYSDYEVIVVNDGSTDNTLETLIKELELVPKMHNFTVGLSNAVIINSYKSKKYPTVTVIDKENSGKADSLNCGISFSRKELVCCLDADSLLEDDALLSVALPFIEEPETVIASGGTIRVVNGSQVVNHKVIKPRVSNNPLVILQVIEYIRSFMCGRVGWNALNSTLVISGAFGLFSREAIINIGGYELKTVGEDMEVIMDLHKFYRLKLKKDYKIVFLPDPVCWTEVPESLVTLRRQRSRWQRGLYQSLSLYKDFFLNRKMGFIGFLGYPYFLFVELLSPLVELLSYIILFLAWKYEILNTQMAIVFFTVGILYGMLMTIMALIIEENYFTRYIRIRDFLKLTLASVIESFGYRQLLNIFRLYAFIEILFGVKKWGKQKRKGFTS